MRDYTVSIVTPWFNHGELLPAYEAAVQGADEVIIVDNASNAMTAQHLNAFCKRFSAAPGRTAQYIRNFENLGFGRAANQGLKVASSNILICLNNDIKATGDWIGHLKANFDPCAIHGKNLNYHVVENVEVLYVDGWFVAADWGVWQSLGFYDADTYLFAYYEDADLCFRAVMEFDYRLKPLEDIPLLHLEHGGIVGNTTSRDMTAMRERYGAENRAKFFERVRTKMQEAQG